MRKIRRMMLHHASYFYIVPLKSPQRGDGRPGNLRYTGSVKNYVLRGKVPLRRYIAGENMKKEKRKNLIRLTRDAQKQGVAMQHRLLFYWLTLLLVFSAALVIILSAVGVFSGTEEWLRQVLDVQQEHAYTELTEQVETLAARSNALARQTAAIADARYPSGDLSQLNGDAEGIVQLQNQLYNVLDTVLHVSPCSGMYLILDASADAAEDSRMGIYLRLADLQEELAVDREAVLYRGTADAFKTEKHGSWQAEFSTAAIPCYKELLSGQKQMWIGLARLSGIGENSLILAVPVISDSGRVIGICGAEIGCGHYGLSNPVREGEFGSIVTVLAPVKDGALYLAGGLVGSPEESDLHNTEMLQPDQGRFFCTYTGSAGSYYGIHTALREEWGGEEICMATLLPTEPARGMAMHERLWWIVGAALFAAVMLVFSLVLSRRFVSPISRGLEAIGSNDEQDAEPTGISEIDAILLLLKQQRRKQESALLPPEVEELFSTFARQAASLTATEKNILRLYGQGMEINDVAQMLFISIHTVRKHNANMYAKLGVNSRDELMLYLELFRRSGRLEELF